MPTSKFIILLAFALATKFAHAGTSSSLLPEIEALPLSVHTVITCGSWSQNDMSGYYRVVLGEVFSGAGNEIYVQWIRSNMQGQTGFEVKKTMGFTELNNDHNQYLFSSIKCKKVGSYYSVFLLGTNEHDEKQLVQKFEIRLIGFGKYELLQNSRKVGGSK